MFSLPLLLLLAADVPTTHPLDPETVMRAMRKAVPVRPDREEAQIEIVDLSHFPVPDGPLEFDWKNIAPPGSGQSTARWRGIVRRDMDRTFSIWAVVRITVPCKRVVAAEPIKPDEPITASQLQEESYEGFPSETCESKIENVVGKVATRNISTNSPVLRTMLATPASVLKGEQAIAEYRSGGVMLSLPVIVQRNGRIGEIIQVLNPTSHKTLLAQVIGEGRVTIEGASRTSNTEK